MTAAVGGACGLEVESRSLEVIDGQRTPPGWYEATGAIVTSDGSSLALRCTGTLIAPDVVLTAAHCVDSDAAVPQFTLELDANAASPDHAYAGVSMYQHPAYRANASGPKAHDVGVLLLANPVTSVRPDSLPRASSAARLLDIGATVELVGYGMTDASDPAHAGVKHHGAAELVRVDDYELWIGRRGQQQNCYGDSGGPGYVRDGTGRHLVGIVSRGSLGCDEGAIDTRVDAHLDWIASIAPTACDDAPCGAGDVPGSAGPNALVGGCRTTRGAPSPSLALLLAVALPWWRRRRRR